ncbi:MAG TPA: hypothetical protein VLS91_05130 [Acidimicrobiales bacterium]|nr:hypothetical protein [Acidimicrobiales bacterium]
MRFHALTIVLGWTAVVLGLVSVATQLRRVAVRGIEGVSLATWVIFVYMGLFWITYGVIARSPEIVMGSLLALPVQLGILYRLAPWRNAKVLVQSFAFFALFTIVPTYLGGWSDGVYGIGLAMSITRGPQILELIRSRDASGVSAASWAVSAVGASLWMIYYVGARLWAPFVATGLAGAASLTIAALAFWRHEESRRRLELEAAFSS